MSPLGEHGAANRTPHGGLAVTREGPEVVVVVGATGTGKSDLAMDLAEHLGGEIVNTDSMQFYRGMDIGTAKVPVDQRRGIAHHLLDHLDIHEEASVAAFQAQCHAVIEDVHARGRRAVLVGGSGLYVRAAVDVLEFPPTDPAVRAQIEADMHRVGLTEMHRRLAALDPESASRIHDERRVVRALEVMEITGRTFTSYMPQREYVRPTVQIGLTMDRPALHAGLARRVEQMYARGLLEEVRSLEDQGLSTTRTASRAIGYPQALRVLDGSMTREEAIEETSVATRQFARRQETWFRADPRVRWLPAGGETTLARALESIASP